LINNFTVLYVEDCKDAQEHMKMILEDSVKEFYQAFNGEEGIHVYEEKRPDIILTDINMPYLDGLEMASRIRENDSKIPIVIMSAFDDKNSLHKAIKIKVDCFIPKPIDIDLLENGLKAIAKKLQYKRDSELIRTNERDKLYNLAHFDILTNVSNRLYFDTKIEQVLSKANRDKSFVTLFYIDLDNFKTINDTYGHKAGDEILKSFTKNIKSIIRVEDTLSRLGGDEFTLIVEGVEDRKSLDLLANKVLNAASTSIFFNGENINVTCSIGISSFPKDSDSKEELIHWADVAMYKAKESGKSDFIYFEDLAKEV